MIVERTLDVGIILSILTNKEVFDAISEDTATFNDIHIDVIKDYWLKITVENQVIGVVQFKQMFNKCYDSHIHILPWYRKKHSIDSGKEIIKWCKNNLSGCLLYTNVPVFCENVKRFLISFDFIEQGILPNAWSKNGVMNDMSIMTREV